jgi:hypothetical protein
MQLSLRLLSLSYLKLAYTGHPLIYVLNIGFAVVTIIAAFYMEIKQIRIPIATGYVEGTFPVFLRYSF